MGNFTVDRSMLPAQSGNERESGNSEDARGMGESIIKEEATEVGAAEEVDGSDTMRGTKRTRTAETERQGVKNDAGTWEVKIRLVEELRKCATVMRGLGMREDAENCLRRVIEVVDEIGLERMKRSRAGISGR